MSEKEINVWPVGQAFADFVNAYCNFPVWEDYYYHGLRKKCRRRPRPGPFRKDFCKPLGEEWILVFDGSIACRWGKYFIFDANGFLYSSDDYKCPSAPVGTKNKYYFAEVEYIKRPDWPFAWISFSDGLNCKYTTISSSEWTYIYRAYFNIVWYGENHVLWVCSAAEGSRGRVWKSLTGEFPGYYPVAQGHKEY